MSHLHPSPSVRLLQQQYLHPHSSASFDPITDVSSRPRRAATQADRKRRRLEEEDYVGSDSEEYQDSHPSSSSQDQMDDDEDDVQPSKRGPRTKCTSAEAKRLRRQQQNRDAAATSRNRKKQYLLTLESKNSSLEQENTRLKQQLKETMKQMQLLRQQLVSFQSMKQEPTHTMEQDVIPQHEDSVESPPSPESASYTSSAPTSPLSQHESSYSSAGSSPVHLPHAALANRRSVTPLLINVIPDDDFQQASSDFLPPLGSPKFQKQPSLDLSMFQQPTITYCQVQPYENIFQTQHSQAEFNSQQNLLQQQPSQSPHPTNQFSYSNSTQFTTPIVPSQTAQISPSCASSFAHSSLSSSFQMNSTVQTHESAAFISNQQCCLDNLNSHMNQDQQRNYRMQVTQLYQVMVLMQYIMVINSAVVPVCQLMLTWMNHLNNHTQTTLNSSSMKPSYSLKRTSASSCTDNFYQSQQQSSLQSTLHHRPLLISCS